MVAIIFVRRLVKQRLFAFKDERRLRWALKVEEVLERGTVEDHPGELRSSWDRQAAEEALLERLETAEPAERRLLTLLFRDWRLLDWRLSRLRRGNRWQRARSALILSIMQCKEALRDLLWLLEGRREDLITIVNALELLGSPEAIDPLITFYGGRGRGHTRPVLSALIQCGRQAPERLVPYLKHKVVSVRIIAAAALAEVASSGEVSPLCEAASDPDPEVRAKVARALGRTAHPEALAALLQLREDPVWYVRLRAVAALPHIRLPEVHDWLLKSTKDRHWRVRMKAAVALYKLVSDPVYLLDRMEAELNDRYAVEALIEVLEREGETWKAINRLRSPIAMAANDSQDLIARILSARKFACALYAIEMHPELPVRHEVVKLVKDFAGPSVLSPLKALLHSHTLDVETRRRVEDVLAPYGG